MCQNTPFASEFKGKPGHPKGNIAPRYHNILIKTDLWDSSKVPTFDFWILNNLGQKSVFKATKMLEIEAFQKNKGR